MPATVVQMKCPSCGTTLRSKANAATLVVKCPRCAHRFTVAGVPSSEGNGAPELIDLDQPTVGFSARPSGSAESKRSPAVDESEATLAVSAKKAGSSNEGTTQKSRAGTHQQDAEQTVSLPNQDDEATISPQGVVKASRSGSRHTARLTDDDDSPDEPVARRRRKRRDRGGSSRAPIIAGIVIVLLAIAGVVAGVIGLVKRGKNDETNQNTSKSSETEDGKKVTELKSVRGDSRTTDVDTKRPSKPPTRRLVPLPPTGPPVVGTKVGNLAPEIAAEDLNGVALKLSDYRGKVVLLDFWGDWCPFCRFCYPHEKEIVLKLSGRPFVMLGVNTDLTKDQAKQGVQRDQLNWSSWFDGGRGGGPICRQWAIHNFPSVFLIDHNGIIRKVLVGYDDAGLKRLALEVEELVQDAEQGQK